jgi:Ribbon-helix-helix protein, copG family
MDYRMRTLVDIPDSQLRELTDLGRRHNRSRAALIREAVASYLATHKRGTGMMRSGFGDRKGWMAWPITGRLVPTGEGAARYEHTDRPSARYSGGARRIATLSPEGDQHHFEVLVGADSTTGRGTRDFLEGFALLAIDEPVAERAVVLRRAHRLKLPDAIIWGSAQVHSMLLVTREGRAFLSMMIQEYVYHML